MGFFSFIQEIAMDLGTANTIIISDDKIVVDEPSVVALDRRTDKMIAVGEKAKMMYEKTHDIIQHLLGCHGRTLGIKSYRLHIAVEGTLKVTLLAPGVTLLVIFFCCHLLFSFLSFALRNY